MFDDENIFAAIVIIAIVGFAIYAWIIAPARAARKIEELRKLNEVQKAAEVARRAKLSPSERKREDEAVERADADAKRKQNEELAASREYYLSRAYGAIVPALICTHCQSKGTVRRCETTADELVHAANHTFKKKKVTQMFCEKCETKWTV